MVDEYFMTTAEKAEELGLSESRARKLCALGKIPAFSFEGEFWFSRSF